jgi:hypothetical protein
MKKYITAIGDLVLALDIGLTLFLLNIVQECRSEISSFDFFFPSYSESCLYWEVGSLVTAVFSFIGIGILLLGILTPMKLINKL